ncbi:MAG: hypothetical protein HUJ63_05180 [Enterococcus sp.]|nr:hypothetical protein [Enterococcus sp.]
MFEQDYLGRMIKDFIEGLIRTLKESRELENPLESASSIEKILENCTDIDGQILLNLQPESMVNMFQVTNIDPKLCPFIAHSLQLESHLLKKAGKPELAELRMNQAKAVANAYDIDLEEPPLELKESLSDKDFETLSELGIDLNAEKA